MLFNTCFGKSFAPKLYRNPLRTGLKNHSYSWFPTHVSYQSYIEIHSKLDPEIIRFHYFRHRFRTKLYRNPLQTGFGHRSFGTIWTMFHTKTILKSAQNRFKKSFDFMISDTCFVRHCSITFVFCTSNRSTTYHYMYTPHVINLLTQPCQLSATDPWTPRPISSDHPTLPSPLPTHQPRFCFRRPLCINQDSQRGYK